MVMTDPHPTVLALQEVIAQLDALRDPPPAVVEALAQLRNPILPEVEQLALLDPREG